MVAKYLGQILAQESNDGSNSYINHSISSTASSIRDHSGGQDW